MDTRKIELLIPDDVQKYASRQIAKRTVKALVIILFVVFALIYYVDEFWASIRFWTVPVYVGVLAFTYVISGIGKILSDKTWYGVIKDVKVTTTLEQRAKGGGSGGRYYKNTLYIIVERSDAKMIKQVVYEGDAKYGSELGFYLKNYRVGVLVVHVRGTKFLHIDPDNDPDTMNCVVCGYDNPRGAEVCETCGHTLRLIKKDETMWYYE